MVFLSTCADAYQSYCCVDSVVMPLLLDSDLGFPDIARLTQLKERKHAPRANQFTAATFDEEKLKEKDSKKAEKVAPNREPTLATYSEPHQCSAV